MATPDPIPLDEPASVVLDGSGNGEVTIGPTRSRQVWNVTSVAVRTVQDDPTNEAQCRIFVNGRYRAGTFSGSSGDDTDLTVRLGRNNKITAQWTGGDAGVRAEMLLTGWLELE